MRSCPMARAGVRFSWLFLYLSMRFRILVSRLPSKRSFVALPFALVAITVLFSIPGKTITAFHFLMWNLTITDMGLLRFMSILVRSWLSVQMAILLVSVARFPDIVHALEHCACQPSSLRSLRSLSLSLVLVDEVFRLLRAREARSAAAAGTRSGGGVVWRARVAGNMAGQLFLRSLRTQ